MTILAALDDSAAAGPVLDIAGRLGALLEATVEAVHVAEDGTGQRATAIAEAAHVPLRLRRGDVGAAVRAEVAERGATVLVIGARAAAAGASPAGHIALDMVQSLDCAIVVVPPGAASRPLRRVLVAVEGDGESEGLKGLFDHLGDLATPEVIAIHVIEPSALPPFADSPVLEADAFKREFKIRAASSLLPDPSRVRFEMRVGETARVLSDATRELDADLLVLAWHRDLSEGHGRQVREMLAGALIPIVLLPLARRGPSSSGAGPTDSPENGA